MRVCYGQLFFYFTFAMLYLFLTSPNTNPHILYPSLVAYILGLGGAIIAIFRWCMLLYLNLFVIQTTVFYMSVEARIGNTTWQSNYLEKLHDRWVVSAWRWKNCQTSCESFDKDQKMTMAKYHKRKLNSKEVRDTV